MSLAGNEERGDWKNYFIPYFPSFSLL